MKALEKIIEAKENINMGYNEWAINCLDEAIAELEEAMKPKTCEWKECDDEHNTHWQGTCGAKWTIEHGTPQENHMNFCPQCGGKLVHIYSKNNA